MQYSETYPTSTTLKSKIEKRQINTILLGGEGFHDINGRPTCSVGLWVHDSNGQNYIMTAGHCCLQSPRNAQGFVDLYQLGWYSPPTYRYIGQYEYYSRTPYDFGLIRQIGTNVTLSAMINNLDISHPNPYAVLFIGDTKMVTSVGASICKSGRITHVTCGEVLELDVVELFRNLDNLTEISWEMIDTNIISIAGDSGGTVFTYSTIPPYVSVVGTVIGGNDYTTVFLPLSVSFRDSRLVYNLNLSVIVFPPH
ncbi:S1 family peptidase [Gigaspora margarita]|uniref:S1 family peptidase n=1 Tax=Gigaspora margarita TaxID=4874 RepID=A0A8H4A995_GIGMA|nr:S1 family peptidase [Gigaspora margarita]